MASYWTLETLVDAPPELFLVLVALTGWNLSVIRVLFLQLLEIIFAHDCAF